MQTPDRRPRRLEVEFTSPSCALVRGYGSRELIVDMVGRAPVWATLSRGWVVQPSKVRDLIAAAESRGYEVTTIGSGQDHHDPGGGRW